MNYSVFKLQNQGGKPGIFWEKETIPKNDRKFGYKKKEQRFPIRRYPGDRNQVETDLVTLSPDEPPPPPKPAKNFIKRNRQKVTAKKEAPNSVTLTQEQLNAILKSVGKVAGGSENAVKISIDKNNETKEILVESPRRYDRDDDDDYDDRKERRRKKKSDRNEEEGSSIYSLIGGNKTKASSDTGSAVSDASIELRRVTKHYKSRRERKSRREIELEDEIENYIKDKNKNNKNDIDYEDNLRDKKSSRSRSKSKNKQTELEKEIEEIRKNKARLSELENEIEELQRRNRSKHRNEDNDSDYEKESRVKRGRSKRQEWDDDDDDNRDYERGRTRKSDKSRKEDHSREKRGRRTRKEIEEREETVKNDSFNKEEELIPSPRDKIGLPMDLSWRHMTKAERRRLEVARQKLVDEEERKEEVRIKDLNTRYAPEENRKPSPQRHKPPRSDPATRIDRGRETEITNYSDNNNRRGRRSPSPSEQRSLERSPDLPSYTTPDTSPKGPLGVPRRHMTLAEKKRLEWEKERVESSQLEQVGKFDPWGRPGAGAPLRSRSGHVVADYKGRQEHMHGDVIPEEGGPSKETKADPSKEERRNPARGRSPPRAAPQVSQSEQNQPPITMRSSFALGQQIPDYDRLTSAKERERKKWLAELEQQIEEKRQLEMKKAEPKEKETWADKFGTSYRPAPFPEQPKESVSAAIDPFNTSSDRGGGGTLALESHRVQSAQDEKNEDPQSYIRGQNAPIDPVTKKELEGKRQKYLEHQAAVKAQVEEKERQKRLERERKMQEDLEEERKLQSEREMLQKQFDMEQAKLRQKEQQRQAQVNQLKAAMDEAQAKALQEKYQRKMQHLEAGGHDTTKLREHLEAKITPREDGLIVVEPSHVPGLDLSTARTQNLPMMPTTRRDTGHHSQHQVQYGQGQAQQTQGQGYSTQGHIHEPYTEDRVLTPSRYRHPSKPYSDPGSPRREFGTQTGKLNDSGSDVDGEDLSRLLNPRLNRDDSEVDIIYKYERGKKVRVISAPKEAKRTKKPQHVPHPPPSYREQSSPHEHHHEVRNKNELEEQKRKKKLEIQRRKGPVKPGSRPMWGYKNADNKKPQKQSEKDPFYEQKKRESEERRIKREQKLLAMVEANKPVIPDYYVPPPQRSSRSRSRSRDRSPFSDIEMASPREVRLSRRSKSHSPHRQLLHGETDHFDENDNSSKQRRQSRSPSQRRADSPSQESRTVENRPSRARNASPPVPALRHRNEAYQINDGDGRGKTGGKYDDIDPMDAPIQNGEFVPFTRTIDILDPSKAEDPLPLSREATRVANARRAYFEGLHPEKFGNKQYVFQDKHRVLPGNEEGGKNPLMNPSLVLDHPTNRQDQILVQLSTLKQSLMQRQRELETFSPTDLVRMDTDIRA